MGSQLLEMATQVHKSCHIIVEVLYLSLCKCLFAGQVMSPHNSDQMSQRSQLESPIEGVL